MIWTIGPVIAALLLAAALARRQMRTLPVVDPDPFEARIDLPLALLAGVVYAIGASWGLSGHHLLGGDYGDVDFSAYCAGLGALRDGTTATWYAKHSALGGLLLTWPARHLGVLGALTWGAIAFAVPWAAGLFLWARIAGGRMAGVLTLALAAANQQLMWLVRSPSFYPETSAACMIGAAGVAAALRWRTPRALVAGGFGVGLMLTADVRLFTVGAWGLALLGLAAAVGPLRGLPERLALALAPLVPAWWGARALHHAVLPPGERGPGAVLQVGTFLTDIPGYPREVVPWNDIARIDFLWGYDPPWRIPDALLWLVRLSQAIPPGTGETYELRVARAADLWPWMPLVAVGAAAALWALRRQPWALLAGLGLAVPFAANLWLVFHTIAQTRFEAMGMVAVPLVIGVGMGALGGPRWPRAVAGVTTLALVAAVAGWVPGFLSPVAPWRLPRGTTHRVYDVYLRATGHPEGVPELAREGVGEDVRQCVAALAHDVEAGHMGMPFSDAPHADPGMRQMPPAVEAVPR